MDKIRALYLTEMFGHTAALAMSKAGADFVMVIGHVDGDLMNGIASSSAIPIEFSKELMKTCLRKTLETLDAATPDATARQVGGEGLN